MEKKKWLLGEVLDNYDYLRKPLSSMQRESYKGDYPYYGAQGIIDYVADYRYDGEYLLHMMIDKVAHNSAVWLLFINHSYLDRLGLSFYPGIIHEDELFTPILALNSHSIYGLKQSLIKHRIRTSSIIGQRYTQRNLNCYLTVADELLRFSQAPIIHKFLQYTLSKVFYTGHLIPMRHKPAVFWRAVRSGYLKYIGLKSTIVFWLKC